MRLIDMISSAEATIGVERDGDNFFFPGPASFAIDIADCPLRYILNDTVRDATQTLLDQWPDLLQPVDRNLRVPAESFWIEWQESVNDVKKPLRLGLIVEADKSGRSGYLRSFWETAQGIDVSQVRLYFDLDNEVSGDDRCAYPLRTLKSDLSILDDHILVLPDVEWLEYFRRTSSNCIEEIKTCAETVWRDAYRMLSFSRIMTSRIELYQRPIDRSRLNVARLRSKKKPLLDHIELSMDLGSSRIHEKSGSHSRGSSRLHVVRGHLVRRGGAIFWRSTHLRGDESKGVPLRRTVELK